MNDFAFSGKTFYEFIDSISCKRVSNIKFRGYGSSMAPFIRNGNTLTIKLLGNRDVLKTGDIVVVKQTDKEKIFVHRIIQVKKDQYLIKGDNKTRNDGLFSKESILGLITEIKRDSGDNAYYSPWYNRVIAFLSRTRTLNGIILPWSRLLKQQVWERKKNG